MHGRRYFNALAFMLVAFSLPISAQTTLRIEAEDYLSMSGVQTEPTTDEGGGLNVGWIDTNDWLSYSFHVPDPGLYTVRYRVASESNGGHFQLKEAGNDVVLDEVEFGATGGWQNWITVERQVQLSAGNHNVILSALKPNWNINWIELELSTEDLLDNFPAHCVSESPHSSSPLKIEAENFVRMHGIQTETTTDIGGGLNVGWIEPQDTMTYAVELSQAGLYKLSYRVASLARGGSFQLESSGGEVIFDHVTFEATEGWQNWTTVESLVALPAGAQEITIRALSEGWNINWMALELEAPGPLGVRHEAEDYIAMSGVQTEATTDFGGGLNVGYIDAADWISYVVDIAEPGLYNIRYRVASLQHGGDFSLISADGSVIFDEVTFEATGAWQNWVTVESQIELPAGEQTIIINSINSGWNINWFEIDALPINSDACASFRVQAQHYVAMDGVNNELTLDASGGLNVGWIDAGDSMTYEHSQSPGLYRARYRVASPVQGGSFQIEHPNGIVLDTVQFDATGGWQDWITVESSSQFVLDENQIIIRSLNGEWNFNWFDLVPVIDGPHSSSSSSSSSAVSSSPVSSSSSVSSASYTASIQAEDYIAMQGIQTESTTDTGGGLNVGWIDSGDWMAYDVNLPQTGLYRIRYRVASLENGGNFQLEAADGEVVYDAVVFNATGGWQTWTTIEAIAQLPAGYQQVTITSQNSGWNINWFDLAFIDGSSSASSSSDMSSSSSVHSSSSSQIDSSSSYSSSDSSNVSSSSSELISSSSLSSDSSSSWI